jgi:ribosomal protein L3 glutamine methyltransferase
MKSTSQSPPNHNPLNINPKEALLALHSLRDWRRMIVTSLSANLHLGPTGVSPLSFGHGSDSPEGEALQVLSWLTRIHPLDLEKHLDASLCEAEKAQILGKIDERITTRQPMAYVLGEAWFGDLRLKSDARALVPRSLILEALNESLWDALEQSSPEYYERLQSHIIRSQAGDFEHTNLRILDLCTGGGSIAIKAALDFPQALICASDVSKDALALAQENIQLFELEQRITVHQGNLFQGLSDSFDLILCNPPYVSTASMEALPTEFQAEPRLALAGGDDGMDLIREIFKSAPEHMTDDAHLLLEIGHEAPFFEAAFPWLNFSYVPVTAGANMLVLISRADLVEMFEAEK